MKLPSTAWRNLWRHRRRSALTLFSISFGAFLAIMFTSLQDENWAEAVDLAARLGGGHVSAQHPDYHDTPSLKRSVEDTTAIREAALADPNVAKVVDRISGQVMLQTATESFGAFFIAFDPAAEDEQTMSFIGGIEGPMFASADDKGIILGDSLAKNLGAKLGRKVVYTMMDKNGETVSGLARLRAVVDTGADSIDAGVVLLPIGRVREVLGYGPNEATSAAIYLSDQRRSVEVARSLASKVGDDPKVYTWDELQPELASMITMKLGGTRVMNLIIMLLVAAGIFNTLFVSVMERMREFGILIAIGYSPAQLFSMVIWESVWLAITGLVGGFLLAAYPYYWLSTNGLDYSKILGGDTFEVAGIGMSTTLKVGIFSESLLLIILFVVSATMLAGIYPAWRAATVEPVDAIKLV